MEPLPSHQPPTLGKITGSGRGTKLAFGTLSAIGSRVLIAIAPLLTIPISLDYLGSTLFGIWMLGTSLTAALAFADLGFGNSLLTLLPRAIASDDWARGRALVSSAYATLSTASLVLIALIATLWLSGSLSALLEPLLDSQVEATTGAVVIVVSFAAFAVAIPLTIVQRLQYAVQESWKSNLWQVAGALATLIAIALAATFNAGVVGLIAAATFALPFTMAVNTFWFFRGRWKLLAPTLRAVTSTEFRKLARLGSGFLFLSIFSALALNVDNLIVSSVLGLDAVADFAIATRVYSVLTLVVTFTALVLWPAHSDALARHDITWVKKITITMITASGIAVAGAGILLTAVREPLLALWLGQDGLIPLWLALGLVAWSSGLAIASPMFSVQNSAGLLRFQYLGWTAFLLVSIPAKAIAVSYVGVAGLPWAATISYLVTLLPTAVFGYRHALIRAKGP